jgi:hypothetical protein
MQYMPRSDSVDEEVFSVRTWRDKKTGKITFEEWRDSQGQRHRANAPAYFIRDPNTDVVCVELWCKRGKEHREDGPAAINRDSATGRVTSSYWYRDGVRVPKPKRSNPKKRSTSTKPEP